MGLCESLYTHTLKPQPQGFIVFISHSCTAHPYHTYFMSSLLLDAVSDFKTGFLKLGISDILGLITSWLWGPIVGMWNVQSFLPIDDEAFLASLQFW